MKEKLKQWYKEQEFATIPDIKLTLAHARVGCRWMLLSILIGLCVGAFSSFFAWSLGKVTGLREANPWLLYLLPAGGLVIVALYRACGAKSDKGTNILLHAVQENYCNVPALMAPLIFTATLITHLFGGSAGREGAALQMGGSLGNSIGKLFRQKDYNEKILVMSGMSAAFSAVFGTPLAAAVFPMEMVNVGIMQYSALVPCVFASIVANQFAVNMGIHPEAFHIENIPVITPVSLLKILLLGLLCAWVSILFCRCLRTIGSLYSLFIKNPYLKVVVGGLLVIALTLAVGSRYYNGAGTELITMAIDGQVPPMAFLLKMLFTVLTLGAGYKGGEIVPAFCTGATFGCVFGHLLGISPSLCAATGMIAVFCGVTNCPITSMLIGFELFGFSGVRYLLLAISISYLFSGYRGLYKDQVIMQSKFHVKYIHDLNEFDQQ